MVPSLSLAVASLALAVNFLASMGSGPVNCILKSVRRAANPSQDLGAYPNGVTVSLGMWFRIELKFSVRCS